MLFSKTQAIPASTLSTDPLRFTIDITAGKITHVWVRWRFGSGNLCGVRMLLHEFQYWPFPLAEWFPSSRYPLDFAEQLEVTEPPFEIVCEAYNDDDRFPHTVWVSFELMMGSASEIETLSAYLSARSRSYG